MKRGAFASQKCYVDSGEAWSVNEVKLSWNAPLAWITSYLEDVAPRVSDVSSESTTTTTASTSSVVICGDANCDKKVTVADAVAILQFIANKDTYMLSDIGKQNADCYNVGDGITANDALAIQKLDAKVISSLPTKTIE